MDKFIKREDNIDDEDPNFKPMEFKYVSLDGNIVSINDFKSDMLQRYLFYSQENAENAENTDKIEIVHNEQNTHAENKIKLQEENEVVIHQNRNNYGQMNENTENIRIKESTDENNQETEKKLN